MRGGACRLRDSYQLLEKRRDGNVTFVNGDGARWREEVIICYDDSDSTNVDKVAADDKERK